MSRQVYMQSCEALGSTVELRIVSDAEFLIDGVFEKLWNTVFEFEKRFSRFSKESELSQFNHRAGEVVTLSTEFIELLKQVQYFSSLSRGTFNPFILPSLMRAGYKDSMINTTVPVVDYSSRRIVDATALEIGDTWAQIPFDTAIDVGGIGKGYLADILADSLAPYTNAFCLSLGGDMRVSGEEPTGPWHIDVASAKDTEVSIATYKHTTSSSYGIATSGNVRSKLGKTQQHLIDPRTGMPAHSSYSTCTVVAKDAVSADVFASCVLIDGVELAERLMKAHHIDAVFLQGSSQIPSLVLGTGFKHTETENVKNVDATSVYA